MVGLVWTHGCHRKVSTNHELLQLGHEVPADAVPPERDASLPRLHAHH